MKKLLDRRRRAVAALPPLEEVVRGTVFVRQLRCGKPTCRCARGEPHQATYLSVTLAGGRTKQISLPASLVPLARRWVANYHAWWRAMERVSALNREVLLRRREGESDRTRSQKRRDPRRHSP
jgi:hypothetical protein